MASTRNLQFIPTACASLGLPLALFMMSHHAVSLVKVLMEHLSACHCPQVVLTESGEDASSISSEVATVDICSDESDFGMQGLHGFKSN